MKRKRTVWLSLLVAFVLALTMAFAFVGCGGDETPNPEEPGTENPTDPTDPTDPVDPGTENVAKVTLDKDKLTLEILETWQLTATKENTEDAIVWTSSAPGVATVSETGLVSAVAVGTADITATAGTASATCHVTVTESPAAPVVTFENTSEITLDFGKTYPVTASVSWKNETLTDHVTWQWTIEDETIATVTSDGATATVTAQNTVGTTTLTATATVEGAETPAAATLTVNVQKPTIIAQFVGGGCFYSRRQRETGCYPLHNYARRGDHAQCAQ